MKNAGPDAAGTALYWRDVSVAVPPSRSHPSKQLLSSVSGYSRPGELLYIMGPSGSGKSTLLDALSSSSSSALSVSGTQYLNTSPKTRRDLRRVAKYVAQSDTLTGILTVRETLRFHADLYLSLPSSERDVRVSAVMSSLGLSAHADTRVGNAFTRGLSGGQRRRLSIGCELIAAPRLLFLDEPGTGLDAATALAVGRELKRVAIEGGISLALTVHQPGERLFELADNLLLLSKGRVAYFGAANMAVHHFKGLGYEKPAAQSDVEWMLDMINADFGGNEQQVEHILSSWESSLANETLQGILDGTGIPRADHRKKEEEEGGSKEKDDVKVMEEEEKDDVARYPVSFARQVRVLTGRGARNALRNPAVLWLRFAMYMLLSFCMGLVWWRLGTKASAITPTSFAFYSVAYMVFMSVSVLPAYLEERSILLRERRNGAYSIPAYLTAHTLYEIPYVFLLSLGTSSVLYVMVGLTPTLKRFVIFFADVFCSLLVAESIMLLLAAIIPYLIVAIAAGAMVFGLFMCVQGVFISINRIGWWLRWAKFIALHFYAFSAYMVNQFHGVTYDKEPDLGFPNDVQGKDVITSYGLEQRLWVNFAALLAMVVVYRVLAGLYMQRFLKGS